MIFIGLASYYRRFIERFSRVSYHINSLQKQDTTFVWTSKCEENFQRTKHLLTTGLILKITGPYGEFVVCTDAYNGGVGGVFLQDEHVFCYESPNIKENERNYDTHDLELTTIIHAFKVWRHYLLVEIFLLRTNYIGQKYLFD